MLHSLCRKILPLNVIGYMGNLSPDEILKRIEGESKGKTKGKEKSGANVSKDQSSAVANAPKSGGGRKKSDKKERQADKGPKRSSDSEVAALSAKMETVDIDNEKAAVDESVIPEPERMSTETGNEGVKQAEEADSAATAAARRSTNEATSATAPKAERTTPAEEGLDDEEQYMSADEGANSNASDDVLQYHTDEQSGASGSRDFISDGANYRADNEEVIPPPVTSEEAEFIPVTARSKKRGGGSSGMVQAQAPAQTHPTVLPTDRRSVYSSSIMERGGKTNVRRAETDRSRRGSVQLPTETPASRGNLPAGREKNSPSPIERKGFQKFSGPPRRVTSLADYIGDTTLLKGYGTKVSGGKGHTGGAGAGAAVHPQQQQPQSRPATSIAAGKKTKFGAPSSLQASRTTSPDRRSTQSSTGRYAVAAAAAGSRPSDLTIYPTGSQGSFAKALLSPSHGFEKKGRGSSPGAPPPESTMGAERKVPEAQAAAAASGGGVGKPVSGIEASSSASTNVPSTRSWADIAKKRLPTDVDLRPREAFPPTFTRGLSPERRGAVKEERSISAASSTSGRAEGAKKPEHDGQQRAVSVEAVDADPAVKGYSFFFDPNEPTGTSVAKDEQLEVGDTARGVDSEKAEDAKPSQTASGGVVLNLEGGRRIVLPEGGATTSGPTAVIDSRQCPEVQIMNDLWQEFQEGPTAPVKYKDLLRRKREVEGKVREDQS